MQDDKRKIPIHFGVKRSKVKIATELCHPFGSDTITWVDFNVQLSYFIQMQHGERKIPIHLWSKVKVTSELCQHFGSDTIIWLVFNVQLSYFLHRCRMVRGRYLYILGSKGQGHNGTLSTHWFWHDNLSSFQGTASIFHTQRSDVTVTPRWLAIGTSRTFYRYNSRVKIPKEFRLWCVLLCSIKLWAKGCL